MAWVKINPLPRYSHTGTYKYSGAAQVSWLELAVENQLDGLNYILRCALLLPYSIAGNSSHNKGWLALTVGI